MSDVDTGAPDQDATKTVERVPYRGEYRDHLDDKDPEIKSKEDEPGEPADDTATDGEDPNATGVATPDADATPAQSPVEPEAKVWKKRYDDARRHHNTLVDQNKRLEEQLAAKGDIPLPKTAEEVEKWRKDYPDVYDVINTIASTRTHDELKSHKKDIEEVKKGQEQVKYDRAYNRIVAKHPDFPELIADQVFHDWAATQPKSIQDALYENRNDAAAAIRAVDLYKYDAKPSKPKGDSKKEASKAVTKSKTSEPPDDKGPKIWTEREIGALSDRDYEKLEDEIDQANREGRVVKS